MELKSYYKYLVKWIKTQVKAAGAQGVIVGVSGGVDSAVVAVLCQQSFPDDHLVLMLPCESDQASTNRSQELVSRFRLNALKINLTTSYRQLLTSITTNRHGNSNQVRSKIAAANLKARLRMCTLYYHANRLSYLVVGTDNWPEWYTGYFTKYGDGGVDMVPIIHLLKRDVQNLAVLLKIPDPIVDATPSAGLWHGQADEAELGVSYRQIDQFLLGTPQSPTVEHKIMDHYRQTVHKRRGCLIPELPFHSLDQK